MTELLSGFGAALLTLLVMVVIVYFQPDETSVRIAPLEDVIRHLHEQCECLPEILVSFGRKYEIHRPVKDMEPVDLGELAL